VGDALQMINGEIIRLDTNFKYGTFGAMKIDKQVFCCTLEPFSWANKVNVSCIPTGQYECRLIESPSFGKTYEIMHVPDRTNAMFHPGNTLEDTKGCPILGRKWGVLGKKRAVLNSGDTFREFMDRMGGMPVFHLTITEMF
jgi:hypothetical protein